MGIYSVLFRNVRFFLLGLYCSKSIREEDQAIEKPGIEVLVNSTTGDKATPLEWAYGKAEWVPTDRYHSEADLQFDAFVGLNSYVINRYDYSYSGIGSGIWHDPFIRFFMFPFWW